MKIVVYDVAARKGGGGETILKQYFDKAAKETEHEWWFFVSIEGLRERESRNIHVIYSDIHRRSKPVSYAARKKAELTEHRRLIRKIDPDELISLQNMPVAGVKCRQTVYLHQSLQFSPVRYSFLRKEERNLAFRQRVICGIIRQRLCRADRVIVQTEWMKKAVAKWAGYPETQISVETPAVSVPCPAMKKEKRRNCFIYPANAYLNKNHQIIIEACRILKKQGFNDYRIQFTMSPSGGGMADRLYEVIKREDLPIDFVGHLEREELFEKYQTMVTLFPSYIETFGLPLLEARELGGEILASDRPFSHEILDGYDHAVFIEWDDPESWAKEIKRHCSFRQ